MSDALSIAAAVLLLAVLVGVGVAAGRSLWTQFMLWRHYQKRGPDE